MQFFYAFFTAILPAVCFGLDYIILFSAAILFGLYLNSWIVEKIGGTTGDTYGFITEITEAFIAFLFVLLVKVGHGIFSYISRIMRRVYSGVCEWILLYGDLPD